VNLTQNQLDAISNIKRTRFSKTRLVLTDAQDIAQAVKMGLDLQ
jgi:hypothetical protein